MRVGRRLPARCSALALGAWLSMPSLVAAAEPAPSAAASSLPLDELPALPKAPSLELPKPAAKDLDELEAKLAGLKSEDAAARDAAARELLEVDASLVPALAFRLARVAESADKEALKRAFLAARKRVRDAGQSGADEEEPAEKSGGNDYLAMLVTRGPGKDKAFDDLIAVVGMSRMLTQIGSVDAARALIEVYVRFGEFLRIHTQRELTTLGDRAVAALIEARRHPAQKISSWAGRQLDALGRAVPSEAVQTPDHRALADVLRAYGRVRDPDAIRIVVSFANSERAVVREAARQSIALMGEVAMWQLRDSYEDVLGKKPPRDWGWERTARELFAQFDRMRSASVGQAFDAGRVARAKGDFEAMRRAFDEVLAQDPRYERRSELAAAYSDYAERSLEKNAKSAQEALTRAERLTADPAAKSRIQSLLLTLRAAEEVPRGIADLGLLTRALELDPKNERAQALLSQLQHGAPDHQSERARKWAAGLVGLGALAAVAILLRRRKDPIRPALGDSTGQV